MRSIDAPTLKAWINDGQELAILDAREDGEFGKSHLFWANPCALSRAELRARAILPRRGVRICCVDGGEGELAARLAAYLEGIGCTDVAVLAGGTPAWETAGYVLFSGMNVPSKAFGEWVEHHYHTPSVDPGELRAMMEAGQDMVVLDSRPMDEFRRMSIPGAIDVPGGELVYRIGEIAPRPETTIVVNCAGRTRSIMGAESLRSAGVPNKVVALRNGTMGWELAGFSCDRGKAASFPRGTPASLPTALERARAFAERWGVRSIDRAGLAALQADGSRTTYLLDVRDPEEYLAGHLPGSRMAPGGQLVQGTDNWVAVRGARIVLVDDTGVRARMTGGWLRQLGGWEVHVLEGGLDGPLETGPWRQDCPEAAALSPTSLAPAELAAALEAGAAQVVQLSRSLDFREGALPGALWGVRTRLAALRGRLAPGKRIVVAAAEAAVARLAVPELEGLGIAPVAVLAGGVAAWKAAGLPLSADRRNPEDADCIDVYLRPYDRNDGVEAAMREYLSWEIDLVHEVARDGDARFGQV
ncbi:rhodanese-like domain-containing protein [Paracraurococcus lichenis]|uniref:Rhodanese-like domain-containing protein n=1 Tax=Paracraurococcus lichenis TaxID=3064888 RepID=A0ABT9E3H5_9PROT|nr:rhodanese-like domain-containing protein [Paracraurococcus sp. LOR1-02]MDO9710719.1 rhodanese-like domain-containing protein [Paracraurococcus sp. LOR1-02]